MTVSAINNQNFQLGTKAYDDKLRQSVSHVVNQTFYGTLLRQFRQAQKPTLLGKGPGGSTFVRQLDMEFIERMSQRGDAPLTDAIIKQLTGGNQQYKQQRDLSEINKNDIYQNISEVYGIGNPNV